MAALKGPLGAGKTCFVKGLARSLGVSEEITSPTYTIIFEYEAKLVSGKNETEQKIPFYHIDAYRLEGDDDFGAMGGTEYLGGNGITVVEWCERIKNSFPINTIFIEITILDGKRRLIKIEDHSKESKKE